MEQNVPKDKTKNKIKRAQTTRIEVISLIIITVVLIILTIIVLGPLLNKLFSGSKNDLVSGIPPPIGCPPANVPTGLIATQNLLTTPSIDLSWNAVLIANTPNSIILGYNIYLKNGPGIIKTTPKVAFSVTPFKRLFTDASGAKLKAATTYYMAVTTVDLCGESGFSSEISFTTAV